MNATDKQEVADMLKPLSTEISAIQTSLAKLPPETGPALLENRRVRFEEAGEWARHYSNVRMGVTPFLITLSAGILTFKWQPENGLLPAPASPFILLAFTVWVLACFLFFVFTHRTARQEQNANSHRVHLEVQPPKSTTEKTKYWVSDFPSWAMVALMFGFAILMQAISYVTLSRVMFALAGGALLTVCIGRWKPKA